MRKKGILLFWPFCGLIFLGTPVLARSVPDTGVTKCYDDAGSEISCPSPGQPFYGQDGNYTINSPSYTKLDANGNELPDSAISWAMVRDNVTGLIWEVKTDDGGVHDKDNVYTWNDARNVFIAALNSALFGGQSDWRMPTMKELSYLVGYSIPYPGPTIDTTYFPNTVYAGSSKYWSSTTNASSTGSAWLVYFGNGVLYFRSKSDGNYVRAVRGGQSQNAFVDNGDGTVTDTSTVLMWQQETAPGGYNWEQALAYCENLSLGGHSDWRLPTVKELRSLVDYSQYAPAIDTTFFPNTVSSSHYWSSTTDAASTSGAWDVYFYDGGGHWRYKSDGNYVRAVRGGQSGSLVNLDIRANGSDGPITVSAATPVVIDISLDTGDYAGLNADWWIAATTPFPPPANWYSYVYPAGWSPGVSLCAQAGLFDLAPFEVLNMALPIGTYTFYFALDDPDGAATGAWWGLDSVVVNVN